MLVQHKIPPILSGLFHFPCYPFGLAKRERRQTYVKRTKNATTGKFYRKCPDVLHGPGRRTLDPLCRKNTLSALIRQGKLTAYTYRGKRLSSKGDLLEFLVVATDEPAIWAGKIAVKLPQFCFLTGNN